VQVKAVNGESVSVDAGVIDYGYWQDHQVRCACSFRVRSLGKDWRFPFKLPKDGCHGRVCHQMLIFI
jgi:hypothetical protein